MDVKVTYLQLAEMSKTELATWINGWPEYVEHPLPQWLVEGASRESLLDLAQAIFIVKANAGK